MSKIRRASVAGQFYPGDPKTLQNTLRECLDLAGTVDIDPPARVIGCVAPHAGYMYSGPTAAHTYAAIAGSGVRTVVLVGPSHRDYFTFTSVYDGDAYMTPLGDVAVDTDLAKAVANDADDIVLSDLGHRTEHALEVQVPFLQTVLPGVQIVPITMGVQDRRACDSLASTLSRVLRGTNTLIISSSDLSHFHAYDEAVQIDTQTASMIGAFDSDGLLRALETERVEACGGGPVATVMRAAKQLGATEAKVLYTCNSGDVSGDRSSVVGYLSAVFSGTPA